MMLLHESMARAERQAVAMGGSFIVVVSTVRYDTARCGGGRRDGFEGRVGAI